MDHAIGSIKDKREFRMEFCDDINLIRDIYMLDW